MTKKNIVVLFIGAVLVATIQTMFALRANLRNVPSLARNVPSLARNVLGLVSRRSFSLRSATDDLLAVHVRGEFVPGQHNKFYELTLQNFANSVSKSWIFAIG